MSSQNKERLKWIILIALVLICVVHLDKIGLILSYIGKILFPVAIGAVVAFILNVPMNGYIHLLDKAQTKLKWKLSERGKHNAALVLTIISVLLILTGVIGIIVPNLISTFNSASTMLQEKTPLILAFLEKYDIDTAFIKDFIEKYSGKDIWSTISGSAGNMVSSVYQAASSTISTVVSAVIGITMAVYMLATKDKLEHIFRKMNYAYLKQETAEKIINVWQLVKDKYSKFLSGQCVEAVLLGTLMFLALTIFGIPYASVVAVLTGVFSLIPFVGPFLACATGAILIVLVNPMQALIQIIIFLVVQFIEGQFIYPRVVGGSVGLPPLFTLLAAFLGGNLMGIVGMIFFIPLTSVIYDLVRKDTNGRLKTKKVDV